jgi:tripartite ATP-independent transporter DctP family solute receptor
MSHRFFSVNALRTLCLALLMAVTQGVSALDIRVAHALTDDSHVGRALVKAGEQLAAGSQGRLVLKPIGKGAAGNDQKAMQDVIDGKLEIFISSTSTIVPVNKPFAILDTPFLFAQREEAHALLDGNIGEELLSSASSSGLVGLAFWELGFRNLSNNVRPVTRMEHLEGLRLRTMPSELAISTFRRLGADAKPLAFPLLYKALADGSFDGQENPLPTIVSANLHKVQKYLTLTRHLYGAYAVMASKKWWDGLPAADQALIRKAFRDTRAFQRQESQLATELALRTIKDAKVQVSELDTGERWRMEHKLERVIAPIAAESGLVLWISTSNELSKIRTAQK